MLKRLHATAGRSRQAGTQEVVRKRLAASLVILRERRRQTNTSTSNTSYQVLLVQRSHKMKFASSAWVFPGGIFDESDGEASSFDAYLEKKKAEREGQRRREDNQEEMVRTMRTTALRETFEEVGLLLGHDHKMEFPLHLRSPEVWKEWRRRVHDDASQWRAFLRQAVTAQGRHRKRSHLLSSPVEPLCCFLTPEMEAMRSKRQYLTHFFITKLDHGQKGTTYPWTKVDVDDDETVNARWLEPQQAVELNRRGDLVLFPPQFYILQRLATKFRTADSAIRGASAFCHRKGGLAFVMQPELDLEDRCLVLCVCFPLIQPWAPSRLRQNVQC